MDAEDYDMILRYLDGEMAAEERQAFETRLAQDSELTAGLDQVKDVNETLRIKLHPDENEQALRRNMNALTPGHFKAAVQVVSFKRRLMVGMAVAASAIIILMIWSPWKQQDLYAQYAAIEMPASNVRGESTDSLLKQSADAFNKKAFSKAVPLFETILTTDSSNTFARYYYGISLLQDGQVEKARTQFTQLYNGVSLFRYNAAFYMALSYLKEKNKAACKEWLNKIPVDAEPYSKAQELLKKL